MAWLRCVSMIAKKLLRKEGREVTEHGRTAAIMLAAWKRNACKSVATVGWLQGGRDCCKPSHKMMATKWQHDHQRHGFMMRASNQLLNAKKTLNDEYS